jgi:ABC-type multidrug transport system permease subunit
MAVSYVPAFLEDRSVYIKEGLHNGQYSALAFQVSNFIIGVPFLFLISLSFSVIAYWLVNFNPTAKAFWTFLMWLFLDLLAAESLVVLVTGLLPNGGKCFLFCLPSIALY